MAKTTTKKPAAKKKVAKKPAAKKQAVKKPVAKKKAAPKKKAAAKKPAAKKVTKKAPPKKTVKKAVKKAAPKKKVMKLDAPIATPETPVVLEIQTAQVEQPKANASMKKKEHVVVKKHVVFVHRCQNCHHMPVSVNALFSLFIALIVALSTMVIVGAGGVDLQPILADATPQAPAINVVLNH
jgi:outer membrane biosynthesis protein TonB